MPYTVDPNNPIYPTDLDDASYAAAELRALKAKINGLDGILFTSAGTADAMTGTLPTLVNGLMVMTVPPGANTVVAPTLNGVVITKQNPATGAYTALIAGDYNAASTFVYKYVSVGLGGVPNFVMMVAINQVSSVDIQETTTTMLWTKPATGTVARIEIWGSGAGGARRSVGNAAGGAGGGYFEQWVKLSDLPATSLATVGGAGAQQLTDNTNGNDAGDCSIFSIVFRGAKGGMQIAAGGNALTATPGGVGVVAGYWGGGSTVFPATTSVANGVNIASIGSGISCSSVSAWDASVVTPAPSMRGGGSGGHHSTVLGNYCAGGSSVEAGQGGAGNNAGAGSDGTGVGAGGGSGTTRGGAGTIGRLRVTVF